MNTLVAGGVGASLVTRLLQSTNKPLAYYLIKSADSQGIFLMCSVSKVPDCGFSA